MSQKGKLQQKGKVILAVLSIFLFISCSTNRTIVPQISGSTRDFQLKEPIIIALMDSRQNVQNSQKVIESLQNGLKSIYGNNVIFKPYFDKTEGNSIAIKINIKQIGANFGIRTIHYQTYHNQITAASSSVSTYWGSATATAIVSQPVVRDNVIASGYWVGTSYLEISLVDNFHSVKKIYNFPFVGEDMKSNAMGYMTANNVAKNSWNKVYPRLLDLIDAIAMRVLEEQ